MKLKNYQLEGAAYLAAPSSKLKYLTDKMGLGKTAQALEAIRLSGAKKILIVCPASVRMVWKKEKDKWLSDYETKVFDIKSYEAVSMRDFFVEHNYDVLIFDEAHYLKNPKTNRTVAAEVRLIPKANNVWFLSGTPQTNTIADIWFYLKQSGAINMSYNSFIVQFCQTRVFNGHLTIIGTKPFVTEKIREIFKKVSLGRKTEDVLKELPEERYVTNDISEKIKIPKDLLDSINTYIPDGIESASDLDYIANHLSTLRRYLAQTKVKFVADKILTDYSDGAVKQSLVFGVHTEPLKQLYSKLLGEGIKCGLIVGDTGMNERESLVNQFQDGNIQVLLGNVLSMGTGLTLTAADTIYFLERDWTPANNLQAVKRAVRIGQDKSVLVNLFVVENSIDEKIEKILNRKNKSMVW
jgi:SWI/SNF-related matrix-associated actin-dependent regulator 1 of chromatin subfamily A